MKETTAETLDEYEELMAIAKRHPDVLFIRDPFPAQPTIEERTERLEMVAGTMLEAASAMHEFAQATRDLTKATGELVQAITMSHEGSAKAIAAGLRRSRDLKESIEERIAQLDGQVNAEAPQP